MGCSTCRAGGSSRPRTSGSTSRTRDSPGAAAQGSGRRVRYREPREAGRLPDYSHTIFHTGTQLYLATYTNDIPEFDVTDPFAPVRIGTTTVPGPIAGVHDMFVDGTTIYANNTTAGLVAFEVSGGLGSPVLLGRVPTSYSHTSVAGTVGGRRIVLHGDEGMTMTSDGAAFLRILGGDPRDPDTAPGAMFEGALGIQVVGDLIYVADDLRGLIILRDPALEP